MKASAFVCLVALALLGTCALQASAKQGWDKGVPDLTELKNKYYVHGSGGPWAPKPWGTGVKWEDKPWYNKGDWESKPGNTWGPKPYKPYDPSEWTHPGKGPWSKGLSEACAEGYKPFQPPIVYVSNNGLLSTLEGLVESLSAFPDVPNFKSILSSWWWKDTLLAPTNDAFAELIGALPPALNITDPDVFARARYWLSDVLLYHVVKGSKPTKFLKTGSAFPTAYDGHYVYWQTKGYTQPSTWNKLSWPGRPGKGPLQYVDEQNGAMPVVCADIKASKGLVQVVNSVGLASDLYPSFTAAGKALGLNTLLSLAPVFPDIVALLEQVPAIVFAPTDQAFATFAADLGLDSLTPEQVLAVLVAYHWAPFTNTTEIFVAKPSAVQTFGNFNLTLQPNGANPTSVIYGGGKTAKIVTDFWTPVAHTFVVDAVLVDPLPTKP